MRRQRRTRTPRPGTPDWAVNLLSGKLPPRGSEDYEALLGWQFFGDSVRGLPRGDSAEGMALIREAR